MRRPRTEAADSALRSSAAGSSRRSITAGTSGGNDSARFELALRYEQAPHLLHREGVAVGGVVDEAAELLRYPRSRHPLQQGGGGVLVEAGDPHLPAVAGQIGHQTGERRRAPDLRVSIGPEQQEMGAGNVRARYCNSLSEASSAACRSSRTITRPLFCRPLHEERGRRLEEGAAGEGKIGGQAQVAGPPAGRQLGDKAGKVGRAAAAVPREAGQLGSEDLDPRPERPLAPALRARSPADGNPERLRRISRASARRVLPIPASPFSRKRRP